MQLYTYEDELIEDLEKYRYLVIMKATGLGITEFFLRYAEYKCLTEYENAQVVIITGPNRDLAKMQIELIRKHLQD
jgi:CRISPR/Cas system-associated endonuclease/helicase Cas3